MRVIISSCAVMFVILGSDSASLDAAIIYSADFSVPGQGSTHNTIGDAVDASPIVGSNWTIAFPVPASDSTTNEFITVGGVLRIQDWGGPGRLESNAIDVSAIDLVNIDAAFDVLGAGANQGSENLTFFYRLDGGIDIDTIIDDDAAGLLLPEWDLNSIDVSGAASLAVGFKFDVNGANSGWEILSMNAGSVPEPSTVGMALLFLGLTLICSRRAAKGVLHGCS